MTVLQNLLALLTIVTGLVSLIRPRAVMAFTGLVVPGARGITEIRAVLGGGFVGTVQGQTRPVSSELYHNTESKS